MSRLYAVLLAAVACHSVPGESVDEKRAHIDRWADETLAMLYEQHPEAEGLAEASPGILLVGQKVTKIPFVGAGGGVGVFVDRKTHERLYVKLDRIDIGGGWGVRSTRLVLILQDPSLMEEVGQSKWRFGGGAEATAKSGEAGGTGGGDVGATQAGYAAYELTDAGVSATVTVHVLRLSVYSPLN